MGMLKEFKDFAMKGNVVDMAVGVVIGGAFGKIITSLVNDIIMPMVGMLTGGIDFSNMQWVLKPATADAEAVAVKYGVLINTVLQFVIVAFSIFIVVRQLNRLKKPAPAAPVTTKTCPYCKSEVALEATRCPHCTSQL